MLREPERIFSIDPALNRRSAARLAELEPRLVCFGHGPPLRRPDLLRRFVARFTVARLGWLWPCPIGRDRLESALVRGRMR